MKKGLNDAEKFCLAGYSVTNNVDLAYRLARGGMKNASPESFHRMALRWLRSPMAQEYLAGLSSKGFQSKVNEQGKDRSKEDIIRELNVLATQTTDPKERTAILMKLADLQNMKEDVAKTEKDNRIHYFLPVKYPRNCRECLIFQNGKSEFQKKADKG